VERVLASTGSTKGAFFHHFPSKADLVLATLERYASEGRASLQSALERAERASEDPLDRLLFFAGDTIERADAPSSVEAPLAGCLMACAAYELEEHSPVVRSVMRNFVEHYCETLASMVAAAMAKYPPRIPLSATELAEHLYAIYDGGLVMGRLLDDPRAPVRQLRHAEHYLTLIFAR
jgi:TetR/AcrR family transcriptional repressor of nem operon